MAIVRNVDKQSIEKPQVFAHLVYSVIYHKNLLSCQLLLSIPPFKK